MIPDRLIGVKMVQSPSKNQEETDKLTNIIGDKNWNHFVTSCRVNINKRQSLFTKISSKDPTFMHLDNRGKSIFLMSCKDRQILTWFGKCVLKSFITRNMKTNRSCIPPQHAGTSWWSNETFCVHWLTMLIFCFTVSMIWYRHIQRHIAYTLVLYIPAYIKSVAWLYVFMYTHVYMDTYMHVRIFIYIYAYFQWWRILWALYNIIYHLSYSHNITSECPYNIMRCYYMMLNFKCTVSYFIVLPYMLFLPEMCPMYHYYHVLWQQWRNKDVHSFNDLPVTLKQPWRISENKWHQLSTYNRPTEASQWMKH